MIISEHNLQEYSKVQDGMECNIVFRLDENGGMLLKVTLRVS